MRKTRGGWGETVSPAATVSFPKSRASYFRFGRFNMSPLSESLVQAAEIICCKLNFNEDVSVIFIYLFGKIKLI